MSNKKQIVKTFSIKKTDSPIIKEFIEKQTNFSESIRYLILNYCKENGIEDISSKLSELIYNIDFNKNHTNAVKHDDILNDNNKNQDNSIVQKESSVDKEEKDRNDYSETIALDNKNDIENENNEDIIPDCFDE